MATRANKTQPTEVSVQAFLAQAPHSEDALALCAIMTRLSGEEPRLWGPSIVGFGVRHYKYESGREGSTLKIGFSPRKAALVLYGLGVVGDECALVALGKATTGKGCIYVKKLADVHLAELEALIARTITSHL